jgi:type II secretory pathway pseudopilin PulG
MFNMVITLIVIALIAVIGAATFYYGGSALSEGQIDAEATRYRTEATQIAAAVTLYRAQGNVITTGFSLDTLVDNGYLSTLPAEWEPGTDIILKTLEAGDPSSELICYTANKQSGYSFSSATPGVVAYSTSPTEGIPQCNMPGLDQRVPCCVNTG